MWDEKYTRWKNSKLNIARSKQLEKFKKINRIYRKMKHRRRQKDKQHPWAVKL